jgi:hypothetical protein
MNDAAQAPASAGELTDQQLLKIYSDAQDEAIRQGTPVNLAINEGLRAVHAHGMHEAGGGFTSQDEAARSAISFLEGLGYSIAKASE